ncbi:MAG: S-adenosylmethionine-binding protein [Mesorhizobium sp.]|uniref:MT-A70 family methyltransferase n=1 Tax=Mesorhizobium sp. M7A.F.Ca.ET.027.02.1.1 TaxID=2496655 RepID=UPI000FD3CB0F|nr:MT-A70 family methyltransferase [Mesorhizobium sp. M7A.F.Ca.ET.027.02.1.1]RVD15418.1 S-adenosylmethionine-binding protein [Mesorhizobium sp. M7A.F.Ca.ET.027.02.1.1]RWC98076.1 MAG: S-adenosylmethionine-binding protein [Mesorhizobium sp.]
MKYQLLPRLSAEEFASLERSIIAHGVLVPVEYDEAGEIIDGHHRVEICESLGLVDWPRFVRKGLSEVDKRTLSRELNFARRHLTTAQKQAVIADQLRDTPSISSRAIAAMLGVDHKTVSAVRGKLVGTGEIPQFDETTGRDGRDRPASKTIKTAFVPDQPNVGEYMKGAKMIRAEKQKMAHTVRLAHMDMVAESGRATAPGKLSRTYPVYYADPPWKFGVRSEVTGREKSAENHYPTMTTDEICALMAGLIGDDRNPAVLFLWATNPMLRDGLRVLAECGFAYVHHWIWDKEVAGTGYWGRDRHELLLIGRRGDVAAPLPGSQPETVHRERKSKHSAKPDFYAETIERLFPGVARLELFARAARPGWDAWGYEAETAQQPISPPVGEMAGRPEGGAVPPAFDVDPKLIETVAKGMQTETGRKALVKALDVMIAAEETPKPKRGRPRKAVPA